MSILIDELDLELETHSLNQGEFSGQCFSQSPMSVEYFGRLIATGEWGVCLLYSCKVRYPQKHFFLNFKLFKG